MFYMTLKLCFIIIVITSRRMIWEGYVACMMKNACEILVGKPEWKRSLGKCRHSWKDNINWKFTETGWVDLSGELL